MLTVYRLLMLFHNDIDLNLKINWREILTDIYTIEFPDRDYPALNIMLKAIGYALA